MRIYNPQNECGKRLLDEGHILPNNREVVKTVVDNTVLITPEDFENVSQMVVKHIYEMAGEKVGEELLLPYESTDEGILITVHTDGVNEANKIDKIKVVLEYKGGSSFFASAFDEESGSNIAGGIFESTEEYMAHMHDTSIHFDHETRARFEMLYQKYTAAQVGTEPPPVALQAMSDEQVMAHFAKHAMPGFTLPPSRYYTRWVPNALTGNLGSAIVENNTMGYFPTSAEMPATHTTAGQSVWWGKEWVGYWEYCNFIEAEGCKFPTAIIGDTNFSWNNNVGVLMPALFFNICEEKINGEATDRYGYTIADSAFNDLSTTDQNVLKAHGITTLYRHPAATYYDPNKYGNGLGGYVARPYMVFSAFAGGYEGGKMVSKRNVPQYNQMSYNNYFNNISKKGSGDGMRDGIAHIWEVVKYGTKHSQQTFSGLTSYSPVAFLMSHTTGRADYVVPIASNSNFEPMISVYLTTTSTGANDYPYTMTSTRNEARVLSIENRTITLSDGSEVTTNCLILDPTTIEPFYACKTADEATALITEGKRAFCYVRGSALPLTGETYNVLGHYDGACYSRTNWRHPYRVQGLELLAGAWRLKANTILVTGSASTNTSTRPKITNILDTVYNSANGLPLADNIDEYNANPSSPKLSKETVTGYGGGQQWNFCFLRHQTRLSTTTKATLETNAYCAGQHEGLNGSNQVMQVTIEPISGAIIATKMGTANSNGHRDYRWYGGNELLSGGYWSHSSNGGSAASYGSLGLGHAYANFSAGL